MKRLLNSILIGISYVIPGVCSSTTANSLGEYQNILEVTGNFYHINVLKKHFILILGIIIGVLCVATLMIPANLLKINILACIIVLIFNGASIFGMLLRYIKINKKNSK